MHFADRQMLAYVVQYACKVDTEPSKPATKNKKYLKKGLTNYQTYDIIKSQNKERGVKNEITFNLCCTQCSQRALADS